mgnify:CR=1 FL=1
MKVGFIGFGNMAQALAAGLAASGALQPGQIGACARDRAKLHRNTEPHGFLAFDDAAGVAGFADVVVVAVKPYQVEAVLAPVKGMLAGKVVVSVAAGMTFDRYEEILAPGTHHLSTIPNTPVAVCEGIVVCERRHSLSEAEWQSVQALLSHVGLVVTVDTAQLGIAGTVCGCGPAFVAMFIEALADGGVACGLPRAKAQEYAAQMVLGSAKMVLESGQHPGALKDAVCSPGGSTIQGVRVLEEHGLRGAVMDAVIASYNKTKEMGKG